MTSIDSLLEPFHGYLELGMFVEANDELENLSPDFKAHPAILQARLIVLMKMKKWEDGALLGESLSKLWPATDVFYFKTAFCLHELKKTREAKQVLEAAPVTIRKSPVYAYNLACYEAQLGQVQEAKRLLQICFSQDKRFRQEALDDPDLEPVWASLSSL